MAASYSSGKGLSRAVCRSSSSLTLRATRTHAKVAYPDHFVECEASRDTHAAAWRHEALDTGDVQPGRSRTAFTCRRLPAKHQAVQCMTRATAHIAASMQGDSASQRSISAATPRAQADERCPPPSDGLPLPSAGSV